MMKCVIVSLKSASWLLLITMVLSLMKWQTRKEAEHRRNKTTGTFSPTPFGYSQKTTQSRRPKKMETGHTRRKLPHFQKRMRYLKTKKQNKKNWTDKKEMVVIYAHEVKHSTSSQTLLWAVS